MSWAAIFILVKAVVLVSAKKVVWMIDMLFFGWALELVMLGHTLSLLVATLTVGSLGIQS